MSNLSVRPEADIVSLFLLALLLAAPRPAAIDYAGPLLLAADEPLVFLTQAAAPAGLTLSWTAADGATGTAGPYQVSSGEPMIPLPPGCYTVSARVTGADGASAGGEWTISVLACPKLSAGRLAARLPRLAAAGQEDREPVVLEPGPSLLPAAEPSLAAALSLLLRRAGRTAARAVRPPAGGPLTPARIQSLAAAQQPDLVVLGPAHFAGGDPAPAAVTASEALAAAEAAAVAGADVVVVTPPPRPADGLPGLLRALAEGREWSRRLAGRALVVDSALALASPDAVDAAGLVADLARRVDDTGQLRPAGVLAVAGALLAELAEAPQPRLELRVTRRDEAGRTVVTLRLANPTAQDRRVRLVVLDRPGLAPAEGLTVDLPAGATRDLRRELPPGAGAGLDGFSAALRAGGGLSRVVRAVVAPGPLAAWLRDEGQVGSEPFVTLGIENRTATAVTGVARLPAAGAAATFHAEGRQTVALRLPVALPAAMAGELPLRAEVTAGDERSVTAGRLRYARAVVAERAEAAVDGDVGEWTTTSWYAVGAVRFAARATATGLALAVTGPGAGTVELLWDGRDESELGRPGRPSRASLDLATGRVAGGADGVETAGGAGVVELRLPWASLGGVEPRDGRRFGFDLAAGEARLAGEAWSGRTAERLGLLVVGAVAGRAPVRWRVMTGEPDSTIAQEGQAASDGP